MIIRKFVSVAAAFGLLLVSCGAPTAAPSQDTGSGIELEYASQFTAGQREDGCYTLTIGDDSYLVVPEGVSVPADTGDMTVIQQPVKNIYVAASSAMDLFDGIGRLGDVTMTSTSAENWSLPAVREALENGRITYIGKYSSPDYEALLSEECSLVIESTMIYHTPEVREKIESLGIPVIVERSSYETHPLGRMEWMKAYGILTGIPEEAERIFSEKTKAFNGIEVKDIPEEERKSAAFFYFTSNGYVNIRKPSDYVPEMIRLAGGRYAFTADDLKVDENALSTMNIQTETFFGLAHDADILIYNSTVSGDPGSLDALVSQYGILADMKAVKEGNVWCTGQNMFQQTTGAADMICDLNRIFTDDSVSAELTYLHRLT